MHGAVACDPPPRPFKPSRILGPKWLLALPMCWQLASSTILSITMVAIIRVRVRAQTRQAPHLRAGVMG